VLGEQKHEQCQEKEYQIVQQQYLFPHLQQQESDHDHEAFHDFHDF
jgi:hypothetical protein